MLHSTLWLVMLTLQHRYDISSIAVQQHMHKYMYNMCNVLFVVVNFCM